MSDYILKFWPVEVVEEIKVATIQNALSEHEFVGVEKEFWGQKGFSTGKNFTKYLAPHIDPSNSYLDSLSIAIKEKDYGVLVGEDDFEYINRNNVVSIHGGDDYLNNWSALCEILEACTGDKYVGDWEIL